MPGDESADASSFEKLNSGITSGNQTLGGVKLSEWVKGEMSRHLGSWTVGRLGAWAVFQSKYLFT